MVRTSGRSRGCQICRQRRIKCDETLPHCIQCRRTGRQCPGPITGTFYVVATHDSALLPHGVTFVKEDVSSLTASGPNSDESPTGSLLPNLPSCYQPSRAAAFDQLFLSHFLSGSGGQGGLQRIGINSWLKELPDLLDSSYSSLSLKFSTRAASMVYYGLRTGQISIQTEACKTYIRALRSRFAEISQGPSHHGASQILASDSVICTSLIMSHFEVMTEPSGSGWIQHIRAAVIALEEKGPENFWYGITNQLFRTLRIGIAFARLMFSTPQLFAQEVRIISSFHIQKQAVDYLVDVVLELPQYIILAERISRKPPPADVPEILPKLHASLTGLISSLDEHTKNNQDAHKSEALLSAISHAAYLVCFSLLASIDTNDGGFQDEAFRHSQLLLDYVLAVYAWPGSRHLTAVFVLTVLSRWSPSPNHRALSLKSLKGAPKGIFNSIN